MILRCAAQIANSRAKKFIPIAGGRITTWQLSPEFLSRICPQPKWITLTKITPFLGVALIYWLVNEGEIKTSTPTFRVTWVYRPHNIGGDLFCNYMEYQCLSPIMLPSSSQKVLLLKANPINSWHHFYLRVCLLGN